MNSGTRLLNEPRTLNAANAPRHAPTVTVRMLAGTLRRGRRLNTWSGFATGSGMARSAASANAQTPR